jgi:hypothetical protein
MNFELYDMKRILDLSVKAKWYEMQESGEKTEEYREIKPYWVKRLCPCTHGCSNGHWSEKYNKCVLTCKAVESHMNHYYNGERIGAFTHVRFRYGYTNRTFTHKIDRIRIGRGKPEWGAPTDRDVFIIEHH